MPIEQMRGLHHEDTEKVEISDQDPVTLGGIGVAPNPIHDCGAIHHERNKDHDAEDAGSPEEDRAPA